MKYPVELTKEFLDKLPGDLKTKQLKARYEWLKRQRKLDKATLRNERVRKQKATIPELRIRYLIHKKRDVLRRAMKRAFSALKSINKQERKLKELMKEYEKYGKFV